MLICSWMSAHPPHIINYIQCYRSHYPASQKLVIRSTPLDLLHRRARTQHLTPAISAVPSSCSISSDVLEMTIHISYLVALTKPATCSLPIRGSHRPSIFDSCPGRAIFRRSVLALSSALPLPGFARLILLGLIYIVYSVYWIASVPVRISHSIEQIRQTLSSHPNMQRYADVIYIAKQIRWPDRVMLRLTLVVRWKMHSWCNVRGSEQVDTAAMSE